MLYIYLLISSFIQLYATTSRCKTSRKSFPKYPDPHLYHRSCWRYGGEKREHVGRAGHRVNLWLCHFLLLPKRDMLAGELRHVLHWSRYADRPRPWLELFRPIKTSTGRQFIRT